MRELLSSSRFSRRAIACCTAAVFICVQSGCVVGKPPSLELHDLLRNEVVALVPAQIETVLKTVPLAGSRPTGALQGAGEGFVGCLQGIGNVSCDGEICGAVLLVLLAVAVTCSAVGTVTGALTATPEPDALTMASATDKALAGLNAHLNLTRRMLAQVAQLDGVTVELVARETERFTTEEAFHRELATRGMTAVLEIGVTRIAFTGGRGRDPELTLEMQAVARILSLPGGEERYREEFNVRGPTRSYSRWSAQEGVEMQHAVEDGLADVASLMTQRLFEQVDLAIPSGTWTFPGSDRFSCCWLCPESPPLNYNFWGKKLEYPRVASLQPTLVWEAFPLPVQAETLRADLGGVPQNIRYDLRIWEVRKERPGSLIYERSGLPLPQHRIETPLKLGWRYFWSFRACFDYGRGEVCTPWAWSLAPAGGTCERTDIPAENYYRFGT